MVFLLGAAACWACPPYCDLKTADLKAACSQNVWVSSTPNPLSPPTPSARALLAANVVALRHAKGWSQEALAFECGLHRTFVAHVERQARNIALDNVERLAVALGVQTYELLMAPG
nr:transcriptional regulator, XRE family [Polaromonas sp.]